jgi:hypothetical protein
MGLRDVDTNYRYTSIVRGINQTSHSINRHFKNLETQRHNLINVCKQFICLDNFLARKEEFVTFTQNFQNST